MVLRLSTPAKRQLFLLGTSLLLTLVFLYPYISSDFLGIEHDTFFHLSRIEGLARSIQEGNLLPDIYPHKNNGFGYGSALFYCDLLLYPFALLYLAGAGISTCYKVLIFCSTLLSIYFMEILVLRISRKKGCAFLGGAAYAFSNYRITDVYVRGALGETMAMIFLPVLILGLYDILQKKRMQSWKILCAGLLGLVLSHNLSFLMAVVFMVILVALYGDRWNKQMWTALLKGSVLAFLLSAFFTLPMLEQTISQRFYLHYYGSFSRLDNDALPLWKLFANRTVFGYSGRNYGPDMSMLVNVGWFLTFFPILSFLLPKVRRNRFVISCTVLGYLCLLAPLEYVPWEALSFLRILQFPWRLNQMAMLFLCISAACAIGSLPEPSHRIVPVLLIVLLTGEGIYHLLPASSRTFCLHADTPYKAITDGKLCDPYYSATYMRVELAGGDYIPMNSPDFRTYSTAIKDMNGNDLPLPYHYDHGLLFELPEQMKGQVLELPVTWYKGYAIQKPDGTWMNAVPDERALVYFKAEQPGTYRLFYRGTPLQKFSAALSLFSLHGTAVTITFLHIRTRKQNI